MSFLSRITAPFKRVKDPEGWQAGDWAECIHAGQWWLFPEGTSNPGPRHGRIGRVVDVQTFKVNGKPVLGLSFASWPRQYFNAAAFRKLNPRADEATAADAAFTALVSRKRTPADPAETIEEFQ